MASQAPLAPSLYALLPPASYSRLVAQISLAAINAETFHFQDDIFHSSSPSVSGERTLRFRTQFYGTASPTPRPFKTRRLPRADGVGLDGIEDDVDTGGTGGAGSGGGGGGKGKGRASSSEREKETERYSLAYVSQPLSGREYSEMNVRAVLGMDVTGLSSKGEIWEFLEGLGLKHSHSFQREGLLFYLPLPHPSMTLRLSITHVHPVPPGTELEASKSLASNNDTSDVPWLVQLSPSRSVQAVPQRGDPSLADVMAMMREKADRIDMLDWSTARE